MLPNSTTPKKLRTEKVISPSWTSRILGAQKIGFSHLNDKVYLHVNESRTLEIDIEKLNNSNLYKEGPFFAKLTFNTSEGTQSFEYLPKEATRDTYKWLRQLFYRKILPEVSKASAEVRSVLEQDSYLRSSKFQRIRTIAIRQREIFKEVPPQDTVEKQHMDDFKLLNELASWGKKELEVRRKKYLKDKKVEFVNYFDTIEENPLTERQRDACITDEDNNLVLAGAGTGKTSTMVSRAGFLIKSGQARPEQILMLAFARKAADEMQERLNEKFGKTGVVASTFHKLGKDIIADVEGVQPSISPLAEDDIKLTNHVNRWFEEQMQETAYRQKVIEYFDHYLYPQVNPFDFKSESEYFNYIQANGIRTLKGEKVKSLGECLIANCLFKLGIEYRYEAKYKYSTRSRDHRQYQPDFYLPEYEIYIEHFGIDKNGNTPPYVNRGKYHRDMNWKREIHKKYGTHLIETYYYEQTEDSLLSSLKTKLKRAGVTFNPRSSENVLKDLKDFGAISEFAKLLTQFLQLYNACHFEEEQIADVIRGSSDPSQASEALNLLKPIIGSYKKKLSDEDQIDFDDMIGRAITYVNEGRFNSRWRYILVDEFQDISDPRARLIKALRDSADDCSLFCVGDDWQSIYRFTGSDIAFITQFADEFGATKITRLDKTFRFNNSICDVTSKFILKNPAQIQKTLSTHTVAEQPAISILRTNYATTEDSSELDPILQEVLNKISSHVEKSSTVYFLSRFRFDLPSDQTLKKLDKDHPDLSVSAMTIHGSKGKEADFVVVLNLQSGEYGFPSQKSTHPLLESFLPKSESFLYAEERRLFYVALTRARYRVYLICNYNRNIASDFVVELIRENYPIEMEEFESGCVKCGNPMKRLEEIRVCTDPQCDMKVPICQLCGADMVERKGPYGTFWGCRNYRLNEQVSCTYTVNPVQ